MISALRATAIMALLFAGTILILFPSGAQCRTPQSTPTAEGIWQGTLKTGGAEIRILFHVSRSADGSFTATMDVPEQGVTGVRADTATIQGNSLHIEVKRLGLAYDGELSADLKMVTGTLIQGPKKIPMNLARLETAVEARAVIEPKRPFPYDEEDVSYENKAAGVTLAGTLTLPRSKGPFPAVLLITGSGPQDRDETVYGHKPFLVLSDYLTRAGIAVLRVDDRGIGKSTGKFVGSTTEDFAGDARAGVEYLKKRKEIDPKQIGLIGHSEGGEIAPMIASKSSDIAFIVLMAGPGVPGDQLLCAQTEALLRAGGESEPHISEALKVQAERYSILKRNLDRETAEKELRAVEEKVRSSLPEDQQKKLTDEVINKEVTKMLDPWLRYFVTYDPRPALEKVKCPVLALNGSNDLQVPARQSLPSIEQALEAGGNTDHEIVEIPKLNHLFQTCETGLPTEYGGIAETVSPLALETIGEWIQRHVKKP